MSRRPAIQPAVWALISVRFLILWLKFGGWQRGGRVIRRIAHRLPCFGRRAALARRRSGCERSIGGRSAAAVRTDPGPVALWPDPNAARLIKERRPFS